MKSLPPPPAKEAHEAHDASWPKLDFGGAIVGAALGAAISVGFGALGMGGLVACPLFGALWGAVRGAQGGLDHHD